MYCYNRLHSYAIMTKNTPSTNGTENNGLKTTNAAKLSPLITRNRINIGLHVLVGTLMVYITLAEFNEWWLMHTKGSRRVTI